MSKHSEIDQFLRNPGARSAFGVFSVVAIVASYQLGRMMPRSNSSDGEAKSAITSALPPKVRTRPLPSAVDRRTGIEIVPHVQRNMFPEDWADPVSSTTASAPDPDLVPNAIEGIKRALKKYPSSFLRKNLYRVFVVNNLIVDGQPCGGVNSPEKKTIYVDLDNLESGEVAAWSEETIHHEFAHLLADNHPHNISMQSWARLNTRGFVYGNGGTDAIRVGADGDEITPEFLSQGFVEQYSKSDPSEDFATLCERMFSGDRDVQKATAKYPLLRRKAKRVVAFYHSLDHSFTESYFNKLQPSR